MVTILCHRREREVNSKCFHNRKGNTKLKAVVTHIHHPPIATQLGSINCTKNSRLNYSSNLILSEIECRCNQSHISELFSTRIPQLPLHHINVHFLVNNLRELAAPITNIFFREHTV